MTLRHRTTVITGGLMLIASLAAAQPPGRNAPTRPGDMSPMQVHQLFDTMLAMQAQDALALGAEEHALFVTRLKTLQDTRRRLQQERVKILSELQRLTNPRTGATPPDEELTARLMALQELETRGAADLRGAYGAIDELLTPLQRARFRVLEEQIERRKLQLVGRARQNTQPRNNSRPTPRRPPGGAKH